MQTFALRGALAIAAAIVASQPQPSAAQPRVRIPADIDAAIASVGGDAFNRTDSMLRAWLRGALPPLDESSVRSTQRIGGPPGSYIALTKSVISWDVTYGVCKQSSERLIWRARGAAKIDHRSVDHSPGARRDSYYNSNNVYATRMTVRIPIALSFGETALTARPGTLSLSSGRQDPAIRKYRTVYGTRLQSRVKRIRWTAAEREAMARDPKSFEWGFRTRPAAC